MASATATSQRHPQTTREILEMVPAWLVSLVVHLSLVLLLAVFTVLGDGGFRDASIVLDCQSDAADGADNDAMLAATIELPSDLAPVPPQDAIAPQLASLEPQPAESSKIDLVNPSPMLGAIAGADVDGDINDALAAPVKTSVFGLAAEGETFVYVFDRSESMNSTLSYTSEGETVFSITPLQAAKAELVRSLGDLDRGQRFHILFYNHEVWTFDPGRGASNRLLVATRENKRRAENFVASVYGNGNTKHVKPLEIALRMRPDVIFLLTDGEEKDDPTAADLARLKRLNGGHTKINVIQFCYTVRTGGALVQLANDNDGKHIFFNIARLGPDMAAVGK
jgi:hypothetical protein